MEDFGQRQLYVKYSGGFRTHIPLHIILANRPEDARDYKHDALLLQ
jgi:hypothetical protein